VTEICSECKFNVDHHLPKLKIKSNCLRLSWITYLHTW